MYWAALIIVSFLFGKAVEKKWLSRSFMCLFGCISQTVSYLIIIFYRIPDNSTKIVDLIVVIVMVCILSAGDSIWESQLPAILQSFYGLDRERNAAMANYKMWQSLGWCLQFAIGAFCSSASYMTMKSGILCGLLLLSYIFVVYLDKKVAKLDMKKGESAALLGEVVTN